MSSVHYPIGFPQPGANAQFATIRGGVRFDPSGLENAAPVYGANAITLDIDEAVGVAGTPDLMYGYTVPLLDAEGNPISLERGDIHFGELLTDKVATANVQPIIILHEGAGGPLVAALGVGGSFENISGDWRISSWRSAGTWLQSPVSVAAANTQGVAFEVLQRSGSQRGISASARDINGAQIYTTNTGTVYSIIAGAGAYTHVTVGVMVTGAFTGTITLKGGLYAVGTSGLISF